MLKVDNPRETMSKIAANFYKNPSIDMNIIGVTGTNGKTSITSIIHHILSNFQNSIIFFKKEKTLNFCRKQKTSIFASQ